MPGFLVITVWPVCVFLLFVIFFNILDFNDILNILEMDLLIFEDALIILMHKNNSMFK